MGYKSRQNRNSKWNRKRMSDVNRPFSTQTTQKTNHQVKTPPRDGEPVVIELSFKNLWEILCQRINRVIRKNQTNPVPMS